MTIRTFFLESRRLLNSTEDKVPPTHTLVVAGIGVNPGLHPLEH